MLKKYFTDKAHIKAIILILFYFLMSYVITDYIISPLVIKIVLSIYNLDLEILQAYLNGLTVADPQFCQYVYDRTNTVLQIVVYSIFTLGITIPSFKTIKMDLFSTGERTDTFAKSVITGFVLFYGCTIAGNILVTILSHMGIGAESANQAFIVQLVKSNMLNFLIIFLTSVILGPIVEELIFRKCFFSLFSNPTVALIISSFTFGIIHALTTPGGILIKLVVSIPYVCSGLGLGLCYKNSNKNIVVPITIHMISNFISIITILNMPTEALQNIFVFF